jgi:hypothetical protein
VQGTPAEECILQLKENDANLAHTLVHRQRDFLNELGFNVWCVDFWENGCSRRLDLIGDFGGKMDFGIAGRVWVELKVFSDATFDRLVRQWKSKLGAGLVTENTRDTSLQGVMLLAARVPKASIGHWGRPTLHGMLLSLGDAVWVDLVGGRKAARGQVKGPKPSIAEVWSRMEWHPIGGTKTVGLLKHFLDALGLPLKHAGQRAATLNALLRQAGETGRLTERKLRTKTGRLPWVASKSTFRRIYQFL